MHVPPDEGDAWLLDDAADATRPPTPRADAAADDVATLREGETEYGRPDARRELSDLVQAIGHSYASDPDYPNYADTPVTLPAGHWRSIRAALASTQRKEG